MISHEEARLGQFPIEHWVRESVHGFELRLRTIMAGTPMKTQTVRYPSNWWQALKDRWLPNWAKARWPVKFTTHELKATRLLSDVPVPKGQRSVIYYEFFPEDP